AYSPREHSVLYSSLFPLPCPLDSLVQGRNQMCARLHSIRILWACLMLSTAVAGCHQAGGAASAGVSSPVPAPAVDPCAVGSPEGEFPRNVRILVTEALSPVRPGEARTRADQIIVRHLYEPLVRVTCDGRIVPALAE